MAITKETKESISEIIIALEGKTQGGRSKRFICTAFLDLPDRELFQDYYAIITKPRSVKMVKELLEGDKYNEALEAYDDLSLIFWNAMWYNESESPISKDAHKLKYMLDTKWQSTESLPQPRTTSPPPDAPQKRHPSPNKRERQTRTKHKSPASPETPSPSTLPPRLVSQIASMSATPTRKPPRQMSVDMDVDISVTSDQEDQGTERDPDSEQIVKQLEKGLPRWQGFGETGWWESDDTSAFEGIVHAIKSHKDVIGNKVSVALESVPEEATLPNLASTLLISLKIIDNKARSGEYTTSQDLDRDFALLFDKARKYHEPQSEAYGSVLLLQRLYNSLTSSTPPTGPPYPSTTNFASIPAGPGSTRPVHGQEYAIHASHLTGGVTSHRVIAKDRTFVDEVSYKGWSFRLADWVHLSNPDDTRRPIVGQIFRCWVSDSEEPGKKGQKGITVAWYFRPEQTYHPPSRTFWTNEIFKTSHFADHPLDDILEKIAVQFTARHIRGRPRPPYWWPGMVLYVCDSRYNDRDRVFVRIKNWSSCIPEEVRKDPNWMPIYPFERSVFPIRHPSPFLTAAAATTVGSGGNTRKMGTGDLIPEPTVAVHSGDQLGDEGGVLGGVSGSGSGVVTPTRNKRTKRNQGLGDLSGPTKGAYAGGVLPATATPSYGGYSSSSNQQLQQPGSLNGTSSSTAFTPQFTVPPPQPYGSGGYSTPTGRRTAAAPATPTPTTNTTMGSGIANGDRSLVGNLGAWSSAKMDILRVGGGLSHHFDRDPLTNEILWFPSPPLNNPSSASLKPGGTAKPRYSLEYLYWLSQKEEREGKKRKRSEEEEEDEEEELLPITIMESVKMVTEGHR